MICIVDPGKMHKEKEFLYHLLLGSFPVSVMFLAPVALARKRRHITAVMVREIGSVW